MQANETPAAKLQYYSSILCRDDAQVAQAKAIAYEFLEYAFSYNMNVTLLQEREFTDYRHFGIYVQHLFEVQPYDREQLETYIEHCTQNGAPRVRPYELGVELTHDTLPG